MSEIDLTQVDAIIERVGNTQDKLIPLLQAIQKQYRYLPDAALRYLARKTGISPAEIIGVSTFYSQFRHKPVGKYIVHVCVGTACHVKGADQVHSALLRHLGISGEEDTDKDRLFTIQKVACLGCCTLAPAVQIEDITYGYLRPETVPHMLEEFLEVQRRGGGKSLKKQEIANRSTEAEIRLGLGSCCQARGSMRLFQAFQEALATTNVPVSVKRVGCVGMCHQTPLVEVVIPGSKPQLYARVQPEDAQEIVWKHFRPRGLGAIISNSMSRLRDKLLTDTTWEPIGRRSIEVKEKPVAAFLGRQQHIATEYCGSLDPVDLEEYRSGGGYQALQRCLHKMTPQDIIAELQKSRLRGRGGAGFPTAVKWSAVQAQNSSRKYIICNGDEGDPGAFMDRMLLESYPYRIIEGMTIAAYTVGAQEGYFYIRAEYPLALEMIRKAMEQCRQHNLLGDNILGSEFSLKLHIMEGAGAFVCGEETALMESIEGHRGMPRLRPPFPAEKGLWSMPTLINNVETYALVPWIIRQGGEAFSRLGTDKSKGTKVFALAGKITRGGLIEVPMGITIGEIIEDIGGGVANGQRFKAVQIGGPSGGCVPATMSHITVDYEALTAAGAIMGSGGMVVLDDKDCMVEIARYFLEFTQDQSCGKCTFCRIGTRRMLDILENLCEGKGRRGDLEKLQELAEMVRKNSICGLGRTAPNPVLSTLKHFRSEYEAHLAGRCPAGKCKALITYSITDNCIGCTLCAQHCPVGAIEFKPYEKHEINAEKCIRCGGCQAVCPAEAVEVH